MANDIYKRLRAAAYEANMLLPKYELAFLTFGNVSVADRDLGVFAIKPSGVRYEVLTPEDMVIVHIVGNTAEEGMRPSSDTPTHARLYQRMDGLGAVVHTHSKYATAFAQAGRPIRCYGTTHADFFNGEVPLTRRLTQAEVGGEYEWETGNVIVERFKEGNIDPLERPAVLVNGHGPFTWGAEWRKAVENAMALEFIAEVALHTEALNSSKTQAEEYLVKKHFTRKHGVNAYYGQSKQS